VNGHQATVIHQLQLLNNVAHRVVVGVQLHLQHKTKQNNIEIFTLLSKKILGS
jgi:hypothetical protein